MTRTHVRTSQRGDPVRLAGTHEPPWGEPAYVRVGASSFSGCCRAVVREGTTFAHLKPCDRGRAGWGGATRAWTRSRLSIGMRVANQRMLDSAPTSCAVGASSSASPDASSPGEPRSISASSRTQRSTARRAFRRGDKEQLVVMACGHPRADEIPNLGKACPAGYFPSATDDRSRPCAVHGAQR